MSVAFVRAASTSVVTSANQDRPNVIDPAALPAGEDKSLRS